MIILHLLVLAMLCQHDFEPNSESKIKGERNEGMDYSWKQSCNRESDNLTDLYVVVILAL